MMEFTMVTPQHYGLQVRHDLTGDIKHQKKDQIH